MDKTININLGGILFQIDEDAYRMLRDYLQAINIRFSNVQGGHETIEDIESRIAEIFQSQKGLAGVITRENVDSMISIIGKPEEFDQEGTIIETPVYTNNKKRMYRNTDDTIVGGVCSGIAAYLDSDPVLFRILFVLFALFFGVGFFVYLALWIALPAARTDSQKRELHGSSYQKRYDSGQSLGTYQPSSKLGNAINEVFRAIGRVFYIILRVLLIIIGVTLVITGFLFILSFVMIFVFKYPGVYSFDSPAVNIFNIPDFLNYIVSPTLVPWIIILASFVFILPMLGLIYWGVKMIFWFKARDGVISLIAFVFWVMCVTALSIICFNEGVSFAESARSTSEIILPRTPDTLYIHSDKKMADLKYEKELSLPHEEYSVFINDGNKEIYIKPFLNIGISENKETRLEVRKHSAGRSQTEAMNKATGIIYNFSLNKDTLNIDEYFTLPSGRKWSADNIELNLSIPSGVILKFDNAIRIRNQLHFRDGDDDYYESRWQYRVGSKGIWVMTDNGLEMVDNQSKK